MFRQYLGSEQRRLQPIRIARTQLQRERPQLIGAETLERGGRGDHGRR